MAQLIFRKAEAIAKERAGVNRGLVKAVQFFVRDLRKALNQPYPPASKPNEYPHKRTGNLRKEIEWYHDEDEMAAEAGATIDAPYWSDLEYGTVWMSPRPFVRPRLAANWKEMQEMVGTELKAEFGG